MAQHKLRLVVLDIRPHPGSSLWLNCEYAVVSVLHIS